MLFLKFIDMKPKHLEKCSMVIEQLNRRQWIILNINWWWGKGQEESEWERERWTEWVDRDFSIYLFIYNSLDCEANKMTSNLCPTLWSKWNFPGRCQMNIIWTCYRRPSFFAVVVVFIRKLPSFHRSSISKLFIIYFVFCAKISATLIVLFLLLFFLLFIWLF